MPHLMNCSHSESGWCMDCVKAEHERTETVVNDLMVQLETNGGVMNACRCPNCQKWAYARDVCPYCKSYAKVANPQFSHTAAELRHISGLLDMLNRTDPDADHVGFDGGLQLYWCDRVMGEIVLDDRDDLASWVYNPAAEKEQGFVPDVVGEAARHPESEAGP